MSWQIAFAELIKSSIHSLISAFKVYPKISHAGTQCFCMFLNCRNVGGISFSSFLTATCNLTCVRKCITTSSPVGGGKGQSYWKVVQLYYAPPSRPPLSGHYFSFLLQETHHFKPFSYFFKKTVIKSSLISSDFGSILAQFLANICSQDPTSFKSKKSVSIDPTFENLCNTHTYQK